jgi:hypothetical protein
MSAQEGGIRTSDLRFIRRDPNRLNYLLETIVQIYYVSFYHRSLSKLANLSCLLFQKKKNKKLILFVKLSNLRGPFQEVHPYIGM